MVGVMGQMKVKQYLKSQDKKSRSTSAARRGEQGGRRRKGTYGRWCFLGLQIRDGPGEREDERHFSVVV